MKLLKYLHLCCLEFKCYLDYCDVVERQKALRADITHKVAVKPGENLKFKQEPCFVIKYTFGKFKIDPYTQNFINTGGPEDEKTLKCPFFDDGFSCLTCDWHNRKIKYQLACEKSSQELFEKYQTVKARRHAMWESMFPRRRQK